MPSFKTTQAMRNAARLGLELRRKFGRGGLTTRDATRRLSHGPRGGVCPAREPGTPRARLGPRP